MEWLNMVAAIMCVVSMAFCANRGAWWSAALMACLALANVAVAFAR